MIKNNFYLKAILLISFIAINIFPAGCFSWGPGYTPSRPVNPPEPYTPVPLPSENPNIEVRVNGEAYISALLCVENHPKALPPDRTEAFNKRETIRSNLTDSKDGNVTENKAIIDNYNNKFQDCNFSALIK
jgi:hypothetical protein